jgi:hypothetical protein
MYRATLRKLYKLIHPDRFGAHVQARRANEHSVQLLNELLAEWRRPTAMEAPKVFPLSFYMHDPQAASGLKHVELELRLQPPYHTGAAALSRLFETVGLGDDYAAELKQHSATRQDVDFYSFIKQAIEETQALREATKKCNAVCDQIMMQLNADS